MFVYNLLLTFDFPRGSGGAKLGGLLARSMKISHLEHQILAFSSVELFQRVKSRSIQKFQILMLAFQW